MKAGTTYSAIIGSVIKNLRESRSMNQGDMSKSMGLTQAAWSKLENGISTLTTSQLAKASDILEVEAHKIIKYADEAAQNFESQEMTVSYDNKDAENIGLMLLGAVAVGAIVTAIILARK